MKELIKYRMLNFVNKCCAYFNPYPLAQIQQDKQKYGIVKMSHGNAGKNLILE